MEGRYIIINLTFEDEGKYMTFSNCRETGRDRNVRWAVLGEIASITAKPMCKAPSSMIDKTWKISKISKYRPLQSISSSLCWQTLDTVS